MQDTDIRTDIKTSKEEEARLAREKEKREKSAAADKIEIKL